jgi:DNA-binding response OmpR family regulator
MSGIVIYEEDDLMRELLREWLREAGYDARAAEPKEPGRGAAADLVIVSVYMPRHGGMHLVREIRAAHPGVPLIAISGQFRLGLSDVGATARTLGAQRAIAKPLSRGDLLDAVHALIGAPELSARHAR